MRPYTYTKVLSLLFALLFLIPQTGKTASKAAIIVGVGDYEEESGIPRLQSTAQEAQNFSDFLRGHGYQPYTLIDSEATKENLRRGVNAFAQEAAQKPFDQVIFYFSGRGTRVSDDPLSPDEDDGWDECLLLGDAKAGDVGTYLRDDEWLLLVSRIRTDVALLILDCSFSGNPEDASVKGFGALAGGGFDGVNPMKEGDIESLQNALVLSASVPEKEAVDGAFTPSLLNALETEDVDTTADRRLSVREIHQYLTDVLGEKQTPQLFDPRQLNPILVDLPPLPTLQITSDPPGAEVFVTPNQGTREYIGQTPRQLERKKGKYRVDIQKLGFRRPPAQEIELAEYDQAYRLELFTLDLIGVHGTVRDADRNLVGNLVGEFQRDGEIVDQKRTGADGAFHLSQERDKWLQLDQEYSVRVTGGKVLKPGVTTFTFTGYEDISLPISVVVDTTPPQLAGIVFSSSRTSPDEDMLIRGDKVSFTITARDDGFGMESAALFLRQGQTGAQEEARLIPLKLSTVEGGDPEGVYKFEYSITKTPSAIENWSVAKIELVDKGGNSRVYHDIEVNINFTVFPDALAMGEHYFKEKAYAKSLAAFGVAEAQTDRSRYLTALAHYELKSTQKALETFLTITDQREYLGGVAPDLPVVPRRFVNKLWGRYLDRLPQNRQDAGYFDLLATTAEVLSRSEDVKLYRKYREKLLAKKKTEARR